MLQGRWIMCECVRKKPCDHTRTKVRPKSRIVYKHIRGFSSYRQLIVCYSSGFYCLERAHCAYTIASCICSSMVKTNERSILSKNNSLPAQPICWQSYMILFGSMLLEHKTLQVRLNKANVLTYLLNHNYMMFLFQNSNY